MKKQIFKRGDRVFVANLGWGIIEHLKENYCSILLEGANYIVRVHKNLVSFSEYTLQGFSQERPNNWDDCIGKWGKFTDIGDEDVVISKLDRVMDMKKEAYPFVSSDGNYYEHFECLTQEQIKILGLE